SAHAAVGGRGAGDARRGAAGADAAALLAAGEVARRAAELIVVAVEGVDAALHDLVQQEGHGAGARVVRVRDQLGDGDSDRSYIGADLEVVVGDEPVGRAGREGRRDRRSQVARAARIVAARYRDGRAAAGVVGR